MYVLRYRSNTSPKRMPHLASVSRRPPFIPDGPVLFVEVRSIATAKRGTPLICHQATSIITYFQSPKPEDIVGPSG